MRLKTYALAGVLAVGLTGSAFAMGEPQYNALRAQANAYPAAAMQPAQRTIELTGVVNGLFADGDRTGFLLRPLDRPDIVILTMAQPDRDLTIGATLRVLAREPQVGVILDALAVTPIVAPGIPAPSAQPAAVVRPVAVVQASETPTRPVRPMMLTPTPVRDETRPASPAERVVEQVAERAADAAGVPTETQDQPAEAPIELTEMVRAYADRITMLNRRVAPEEAQKIAHYIIVKSEKYGVDPRLVFALVKQESNFNKNAVSRAGARGLGQLMPGTAVGLQVYDSFNIEQNLDGTVRYLKGQLDRFGRVSLALAAYNAGPGRVMRAGNTVPNIAETQNYVKVIWRDYCSYAGLDPVTGEPLRG